MERRQTKFKHHCFLVHNMLQPSVSLALIGAEQSVTKHFVGEKEKCTNKGNDKHEDADSLLHNTTNVCTKFQISRCSSS